MPAAPTRNLVENRSGIIAFRGIRYNPALVPDLSEVIAPPYDIISPSRQRYFHDKNPYNAIHIDFGLDLPGDGGENNRYTRASSLLKQWLHEQILLPDSKPSIYYLREEYISENGTAESRDGFIALLRLTDFSEGRVLPHEETSSGPKEDRLKLMQATDANLSPIFCTYTDPDDIISDALAPSLESAPEIRITDEADTRHSLWKIDDDNTCASVSLAFADKTIYIADGHHRYETALAYRDARRALDGPGPDQPYDYLMVYLSSMEQAGRSILPIHRFVSGLPEETLLRLPDSLGKLFKTVEVPGTGAGRQGEIITMMKEQPVSHNVFGMYLKESDSYHVLTAREPRPLAVADATSRSAAYRSLDVAVLDRVILNGILGVTPGGPNAQAKVRFVERTGAALEELTKPGFQVAFFLNPTTIGEIRDVSEAGEKMPQKSTYFYPKPLTGLVFRSYLY